MVVVDRLRKVAHFVPVHLNYKIVHIVDFFKREVFRLHDIPKTIILDIDVNFISAFWKALFTGLGTQIQFSTVYHPYTDGQTEQVNQILEDMLQMYVMQQPTKWEDYFNLVEFTYNNGYQESLKMSPFEALYGRQCRTPINWSSPETKLMLRPEILAEEEQEVKKIRKNLKVSQNWQKVYADRKRTYQEFEVGDNIYVRIRPKKSTLRWTTCTKLAPQFCGPFEILERVGSVTYWLALPGHIQVHNVFHVSILKQYVHDPNHVIHWQKI